MEKAEERESNAISLVDESPQFISQLAGRIRSAWSRNLQNKRLHEMNLLECFRERKGEYGPQELAMIQAQGGSDIYVKSTTGKVRAGIAAIKSIVLPVGKSAFTIDPTPIPTLPPWVQDIVIDRIASNPNMVDAQGNPIPPADQIEILEGMARQEIERMSEIAARNMEKRINDEMEQGGARKALSDAIENFVTYPAAIVKGPYFDMKPKIKYELGPDGKMQTSQIWERTMCFRAIDPFDAYPAPGSDSVQKGDFCERLRMDPSQLYRMRDQMGYNPQEIEEIMQKRSSNKLEGWLFTDVARRQIADEQMFWYESSELDGIHWYGKAQGLELIEWGMSRDIIGDPLDYYEIDAILVDTHVAKATLNPDPLYRRNIWDASYEKVAGTIWGQCPPMMMRSISRMINSTSRAMQNNMAHASGFQVEVNAERVAPETNIKDIHPFKVWHTYESEVATNGASALNFFQPSSNADEYMRIIQVWEGMGESATGIPEFFAGGGGNGMGADGTARGRAMVMEKAGELLRSSVNNFDEGIIEPMVRYMYDYLMQYDPDDSIKGDCQIRAIGAHALMHRENQRNANLALLETTGNHPLDGEIIGVKGRAKLLQKVFDTYEGSTPGEIIPQGEAFDQLVEGIVARQSQQAPDPAIVKVETEAELRSREIALEEQRFQIEQQQDPNAELRNRRDIARMETRSKERVAQMEIEQRVQNEIIQFRAEKMAERSKAQVDVNLAKMKAEFDARTAVAKIKADRDDKREARQFEYESKRQESPAEPPMSADEIARLVEEAVTPLIKTLRTESIEFMNQLTMQLVGENRNGPQEPPVVNVTISPNEPVKKTFTASRDANGNLVGSMTPETPETRETP